MGFIGSSLSERRLSSLAQSGNRRADQRPNIAPERR